jgi:serine/threonine-protein kinase
MDATKRDDVQSSPATTVAAPGPAAAMGGETAQGLLVGLLAAQVGLVERGALLDTVRAWVADRSRDLGDLLRDRGAIDGRRLELLRGLTRATLDQNGDDPARAIATLDPPDSTLRALRRAAAGEQASTVDVPDLGSTVDVPTEESAGRRGRYRMVRFHAEGGLGKVSIAIDDELDRKIALKEIRERYADEPDSRASFVYEAEVTGQLDHPGVVPVYGFGHGDQGRPYYAMRFIRGETLEAAIKAFHGPGGPAGSQRALELRRFLRRFTDVCNAVEYAHSRGVIHRDIKPKNIMLGPHGETLVVDWGLAKPIGRPEGSDETEGTIRRSSSGDYAKSLHGSIKGTAAYMSPEQAEGRVDDLMAASDVYALGATLYEILVGRRAFPRRDDETDDYPILARVRAGDFARPREAKPSLPPSLEAICLKAMKMEPRLRYLSAVALAEDIERWLADEPVLAYPEPLPARAARWVRRHRTAATAAVAMLVVATAGLAIDDIRVSRERAETARALDLAKKEGERAKAEGEKAAAERKIAVAERGRAETARDQAGNRFVLARNAVDQMERLITGPALAGNAEEDKLRHDLALMTLGFNERLLASAPNHGPTRLRAALSARAAGRLGGQAGGFEEPLKQFARSSSLLESLVKSVPNEATYRIELARTIGALGEVYRMNGKIRDAERSYRRAIDVLALPAGRAEAERVRRLAEMRNDLAVALTWRGKYAEARRETEQAAAALEPRAGASDYDGLLLVILRTTQGSAAREAKDAPAAAEALNAAVRRGRELLEKNGGPARPENRDFLLFLAAARSEQGALGTPDPASRDEAVRALDEAIDLLDPLVRHFPQVRAYTRELAIALDRRGAALHAAGRTDRARADLDRARTLLEGLIRAADLPDDHSYLGRNLGHLARAEPDREKAIPLLERAIAEQKAALAAYTESLIDKGLLQEHDDALGALRKGGRP